MSLLVILMVLQVHGQVHINENMKSFSHAIKTEWCNAGEEITVYEHTTGPGVLTEEWYTGANCFNERTTMRYYIDGDSTPTIEADLYMMHGIGYYNKTLPAWGTKWIGHAATDGGLYNTYRIPFQRSIRITFISRDSGHYWFIVRGAENYPVIIGDMLLPPQAKLVLHKIEDKIFPAFAYVPLAATSKSGILFSVALRGDSKNWVWLEGCFGTVIRTGNKAERNFLSSGTEDFFLSAYYFNNGLFQTDDSGLTYFENPGKMSAYKFFHSDPIFLSGNFSLLWRISERVGSNNCWLDPSHEEDTDKIRFVPDVDETIDEMFSGPNEALPTKITSYVWTYEW